MAVPWGKSDWDAAKEREPESGRAARLGLLSAMVAAMVVVGDNSRYRGLDGLGAVVMLDAPWWPASAPFRRPASRDPAPNTRAYPRPSSSLKPTHGYSKGAGVASLELGAAGHPIGEAPDKVDIRSRASLVIQARKNVLLVGSRK